ncbi:CoA-dependent acyltransferase, partial [Corynespora cassiicola Philippines]
MQAAFILGGQSTIHYFETWLLEDLPVLKYAWKRVISMESIFQTAFEQVSPGTFTMRKQDVAVPWEEVVTFDREAYRNELTRLDVQSRPSFSFKSVVYRALGSNGSGCSGSEATIVLSVHHALLDGFSMERLAEKVRRVAAGEEGITAGKSFLTTAQELDTIKRENGSTAIEFWAKHSQSHRKSATGLGLRRPRKGGKAATQKSDNEVNANFEHIGRRLQDKSKRLGVTVASFFHAAWALVQALYSDSSHVVFGSIMSGRNLPLDGIDTVIGPILNSLPFHVSMEGEMSTDELVQRVFQDLVELSCLQWSTPEHGFGRDFEAALSVTRGLDGSTPHNLMRPIRPVRYDFESSIPLSLALDEAAMTLRVVYHADKYTGATVQGLVSCFVSALERLTGSTSVQVCMDSLITAPMQGQLRVMGNCVSGLTTRAAHQGQDLVSLFDTTARKHADVAAIEIGERRVTYAEFDMLASRVAMALSRFDVQGEVVCVHADGSLEWVAGLMGALKADATFCSLDVTLPHELRSDMFRAARSRVF